MIGKTIRHCVYCKLRLEHISDCEKMWKALGIVERRWNFTIGSYNCWHANGTLLVTDHKEEP